MYTGSGTANKQYYHANYQGSVIAMTDTAGVAVDIYTYDPHGNSTTLTGNPFRYTGRRLDAETGLYYYRARYYSPALGRFLQTDPIGYGDGLNWYAYVGNDPVNGVDPSGLNPGAVCLIPPVGAACVAAAQAVVDAAAVVIGIIILTNDDATAGDATEVLTGGKKPGDVTGPDGKPGRDTDKAGKGRGVQNFPDSPTGRSPDDIMGDIADLPGAESQPTDTPGGQGQVVTLPDGTQIADTPAIPERGDKPARPRTIQINEGGRPKVKVRFPKNYKNAGYRQ